jgi:hypothetical protein
LSHQKTFGLNALKCSGISHLSVSKVEVLERSKEAKHLVITCTLTVKNQVIPTNVLIDCGATGVAFMDQDFASHHQTPLQKTKEKKQVQAIDGRPIETGDIMHIANIGMKIHNHSEQLLMFATKLGHYPIVLGIPCSRLLLPMGTGILSAVRVLTCGLVWFQIWAKTRPTLSWLGCYPDWT